MEMITISKKEYESLLKDRAFLNTLTGNGVDNWSGYANAVEEFEEYYGEKEWDIF